MSHLSDQQDQPVVSIIIVTWNCRDYVLRCLETIYANTDLCYEVIVRDNGSVDGTCQAIQGTYPLVKVIGDRQNVGFAAANNEAVKQATGEYLLLLNPDTEIFPTTIIEFVEAAKPYGNQAMLVPTLLNSDGTIQPSRHSFPTLEGIARKSFTVGKKLLQRPPVSSDLSVDWAIGACWFIPRNVFQVVGELDSNFFMYGEDLDYCWRLHQTDFRVVWIPGIRVIHYGNISGQQKWGNQRSVKGHQAVIHFWLKNFNLPYTVVMIAIVMSYILTKAIFTLNRELLSQIIALAQACLDKSTWRSPQG